MRVDCSEPECSTCFHYRTSGISNTHQEPEPSNVIDSTVNPTPVISEPVEALGHDDPAAIASTSTSIKTKTGTLTNQNKNRNTSSSAELPTKPLHPTNFGFSEFAGPKPLWSSFDPMQRNSTSSTHCSIPPGFGASSTTVFPSSSSTFSNRNNGSSSQHGYGPTQDGRDMIGSISASNTYRKNRHGKLTWEDYEKKDKGRLSPRGGWPLATPSRRIPDHPLRRGLEKGKGHVASSPASQFGNRVDYARSDVGYTWPNLSELNRSTITRTVFPTSSVNASSVCKSTTSKNPSSNSIFPGFGVGYLPGSFSDPFVPRRRNSTASSTHCSIPPGFGFKRRTLPQSTLFPSSSSSSSSLATKGSRYQGCAPNASKQVKSISASNAYPMKSHGELNREYFNKLKERGVLAPPAHISPIGSRPNAASPSIFASQSIPYHPQRTTFQKTGGNMTASCGVTSSSTALSQTNPPFTGFSFGSTPSGVTSSSSSRSGQTNAPFTGGLFHPQTKNFEKREETNAPFTGFATTSSPSSSPISTTVPVASSSVVIQRPQETVVVSSPPSSGCCTACGAVISSSASVFSTSNGDATTTLPSSAATSLCGLFSTSGSSSADMSGTTNLATQGKNPGLEAFGKNLDSQGTQTPEVEAPPETGLLEFLDSLFEDYPTRNSHLDLDADRITQTRRDRFIGWGYLIFCFSFCFVLFFFK